MPVKPQGRIIDKRRSIYAEPLSQTAKFLYIYLRDRANTDGVCWPGRDRIAKDLTAGVSSVGRALAELVKARLVAVESNGSHSGTNLYHVYSPDRRADADGQVAHSDPPMAAKAAMKGHIEPRRGSHRPFNAGHIEPLSSTSEEVTTEKRGDDAQRVVLTWSELFKKHRGADPLIAWAKEKARVGPAIRQYGADRVIELLGSFFTSTDEWIVTTDYGIGAFLKSINKLIATPRATATHLGYLNLGRNGEVLS